MEDQDLITNQPGTLLQHGIKTGEDGIARRDYKVGPIEGTPYAIGPRGELRHATPQFKGSKKNRKRFQVKLRAAHAVTPPIGYFELSDDKVLEKLDVIVSVETGRWQYTSVVGITVAQLRAHAPTFPRAARMMTPAK